MWSGKSHNHDHNHSNDNHTPLIKRPSNMSQKTPAKTSYEVRFATSFDKN